MASRIKEFLLFIISVILSILLFEFILENYNPQKQITNWDRRTLIEIYADEKENGLAIPIYPYLFITEYNDIIDSEFRGIYPVGGVENAHTYMCNEWGEYNKFNSDKFGLNNDNQVYEAGKAALLIGDSFSFGACVQEENTLAANIETLSKESILNLSYSGNGPLLALKTLIDVVPHFKGEVTSLIYVYFAGNDFENLNQEFHNKFLRSYLTCGTVEECGYTKNKLENLKVEKLQFLDNLETSDTNTLQSTVEFLKSRILLRNIRKYIIPYSFSSHTLQKFEWNYEAFSKVLELMSNYAAKREIPSIFVYVPDNQGSSRNHDFDYNKDKVLALLKGTHWKVIDLEEEARLNNIELSPPHLGGFGHLTPEGNSFLAQLVSKHMTTN